MQRPAAWSGQSTAVRELLSIFTLTFLTWYLAALSVHPLDSFFTVSLLLAMGVVGYAFWMWRNLQRERALRKHAEELLHASQAHDIASVSGAGAMITPFGRATGVRSVLSEREIEVLGLIASSCSNQQIASELNISLNTVERHSANVYRKLGVRGRVEATAYAVRQGLTTPEFIRRCSETDAP
jgi:DNA-binding NarL/FixJ family response regulator